MACSTYHDQLQILIDKGYLIPKGGSTFDFYETPQPRREQECFDKTRDGYDFENMTASELQQESNPIAANDNPKKRIEINNTENGINNSVTNNGWDWFSQTNPNEGGRIKQVVIPPKETFIF